MREQRIFDLRFTICDLGLARRLCPIPYSLIPIPFLLIALACAALASPVTDPFADTVISYSPGPSWYNYPGSIWTIPSNALGAPHGRYVNEPYYSDTESPVVTLGDGGTITLKFNQPVIDDPRNPYGLDFTVFSNALFMGGNPNLRWQELAFVEISQDGSTWYLIKPSIYPADLRANYGAGADPHNYDLGKSYTAVRGYAEYTPTVGLPQELLYPPFPGVARTNEELYTVPDRPSIPGDNGVTSTIKFDYVSGGGDAFDIASAIAETEPGVPMIASGQTIPAGIDRFSYVRLTDARTGDSWPDLKDVSADIDAVSRTRPALSIGEIKALPAGDYGLVTEAVVTATYATEFFMESPDRSAATRVEWDGRFLVDGERPVQVGDRITIAGHVSNTGGRFTIDDPMLSFTAVGQPLPKPLGMPIRSLGSNLVYGLRVRTWGRIADPGDGWIFTISENGQTVTVDSAEYVEPKPAGALVCVTGICDREEGTGSTIVRMIDPSNDLWAQP